MTRVICTDISKLESAYPALYAAASAERRQRADRYRRKEDALRCLAAGALLRRALGTAEYTAAKGPFGKPYIKGNNRFHYNLSHSGHWVAIAYGNAEVGIDVEKICMDPGKEEIARRYFTPDEQVYVFDTKALAPQRFFEVWTGKESYLKYLGTGLQKDLASFSIFSLEPEVQLYRRTLPGGYSLTLCTTDDNYLFELLDAQQLLVKEN